MKMEIGVWIDHKQAVIVTLLGEKEGIRRIRSNIDRHTHYSGALHTSQITAGTAAHNETADRVRDMYLYNRKKGYYDAVLHQLSTADSIMIFGPNETKNDLQKRLLHHQMSERIVGVQTTDKLSTREFVAKVRQQFDVLNQPS